LLLPDATFDKVILHRGFIEGEPIVLMRRLPDARRADLMLIEGHAPLDARPLLERAMLRLAHFHADAEPHTDPALGDATRARMRVAELLGKLAPVLTQGQRERLMTETSDWLDALAPTLAHRVAEWRVRTVHGEVRLEHLFLPGQGVSDAAIVDPNDGPDDERTLDTAEEVMSLALELDVVLGPELSDRVVDTYAAATADATLRKVARFYKRLGCLRRAAEALLDAAEPAADVAEAESRARYFIERAL